VLSPGTAILGLDPTHPNAFSAEGTISTDQIAKAAAMTASCKPPIQRLIVACHYPVAYPDGIIESRGHGLRGVEDLRRLLCETEPNLFCSGHIHSTWCFTPRNLPRTLCLNPGAALKRGRRSGTRATLLEIELEGNSVQVRHHRLREDWETIVLADAPGFFS
jgi:Icc-related predicted phosphoesterase